MKKLHKVILTIPVVLILAVVLLLVAGVVFGSIDKSKLFSWHPEDAFVHEGPDKVIGSVQAGASNIQFYVDYGPDSAVLGFFTKDATGSPRYFPMHCSTSRDLPTVTLDVFLSDNQQEMWVQSSWQGRGVLAYHRVGSNQCLTEYGDNVSFNTPTPPGIGGGNKTFPNMDPAHSKKVLTITHTAPT